MRRAALMLILSLSLPASVFAGNVKVGLEGRTGFVFDSNPHFFADHLNLVATAELPAGFSCLWRQRFTVPTVGSQPLNATDCLYLNYNVGKWSFSAGKQVLECGGFEYDAPPIDVHFSTECYNNIKCYQIGVSATRELGKYKLTAQFCRSPFAELSSPELNSLKAFNVIVRGRYGGGGWIPYCSANLYEYLPGQYSLQFSLGNRVELGKLAFEFDYINRNRLGNFSLTDDFSCVGYCSIVPLDWMEIMLKAVYDRNVLDWGDALVPKGTDLLKMGVGMYLFPLKNDKSLRFHWYLYHYSERLHFQLGITWKPTLLNLDFK